MDNPYLDYVFRDSFLNKNHTNSFLKEAAIGGNDALLKNIIDISTDTIGRKIAPYVLVSDILVDRSKPENNVISAAIKGGNPACIRVLFEQLDLDKQLLTQEEKVAYLFEAIKTNQPLIVDEILKTGISRDSMATIDMNLAFIKKTDVSILEELHASGVNFSEEALGIIDQKKHLTVGIRLYIGIILMKFTEFMSLRPDITVNFGRFKTAISTLKEEGNKTFHSSREDMQILPHKH